MREFRHPAGKEAAPENDSPAAILGGSPSGAADGSQGKDTFLAANKKYIVPGVAVLVGFGLIALFAALVHHPSVAKTSSIPDVALHTAAAPAQVQQSAAPSSLPTDQNKPQQQQTDHSTVDPSVIQGTASPTPGGSQPLGAVQSFQQPADAGGNKIWTAPPYALAAGGSTTTQESSNVASVRVSQVSKPSLVFVLSAASGVGEAEQARAEATSEGPTITNFGYQPGDHIATHLEAVATTATKAPVIAVVDYNYQRNGVTVIPAGSRIIGTIGQASSTGIMDIQFSSLHLPNGEDVPISGVGLDTQMGALKGTVTGRNRGKQFLLATLAGLGETSSLFAGNSNVTGTLSEGDMIRSQAAQNVGQAADSSISQLGVSEHLIVTLPAGTQVEVTFTAPSKPKKATVL